MKTRMSMKERWLAIIVRKRGWVDRVRERRAAQMPVWRHTYISLPTNGDVVVSQNEQAHTRTADAPCLQHGLAWPAQWFPYWRAARAQVADQAVHDNNYRHKDHPNW